MVVITRLRLIFALLVFLCSYKIVWHKLFCSCVIKMGVWSQWVGLIAAANMVWVGLDVEVPLYLPWSLIVNHVSAVVHLCSPFYNGKFPQTCSISSVWLLPKQSHSVQIAWCTLSARLFTTDWPSLSTAVGWEIPAQLLWSLEKPPFGPQMKPIRATCMNSITRRRIDKTFMHENTIYIIISWYVYTALFFG